MCKKTLKLQTLAIELRVPWEPGQTQSHTAGGFVFWSGTSATTLSPATLVTPG